MSRIARILATEGIFTTHQTVRNTIRRWQKTSSVRDLPRSGPLKRVPEIHYRCIDEAMTRNDELTASGLKDTFSKRFGAVNVLYSVRIIARLCNELVCTTLKQDYYKNTICCNMMKYYLVVMQTLGYCSCFLHKGTQCNRKQVQICTICTRISYKSLQVWSVAK